MGYKHLHVRDEALQCMLQAPVDRGPRGIDDRAVWGTQDMGDKTVWLWLFPYVAMVLFPCDGELLPQVFWVLQAHKGRLQTSEHCPVVWAVRTSLKVADALPGYPTSLRAAGDVTVPGRISTTVGFCKIFVVVQWGERNHIHIQETEPAGSVCADQIPRQMGGVCAFEPCVYPPPQRQRVPNTTIIQETVYCHRRRQRCPSLIGTGNQITPCWGSICSH